MVTPTSSISRLPCLSLPSFMNSPKTAACAITLLMLTEIHRTEAFNPLTAAPFVAFAITSPLGLTIAFGSLCAFTAYALVSKDSAVPHMDIARDYGIWGAAMGISV